MKKIQVSLADGDVENAEGKIIGLCFMLRDAAHKAHLSSTSYAQHMALGTFYSSIIELSDGLAESIQGRTGELLVVPDFQIGKTDIVDILASGRAWIDENRHRVSVHTEIQNDIDSVLTLLNLTIYKLTFLK